MDCSVRLFPNTEQFLVSCVHPGTVSSVTKLTPLRLRSFRPGYRCEGSLPKGRPAHPLSGRIAVGMSSWMLTHPKRPTGVPRYGPRASCSPSTAHDALKGLQAAALVRADNTALIPEFFWAVADRWRPERHYVSREPDPGDDICSLDSGEHGPNFVISSDVAAAAWGAPVVVRSGQRPDFYVPPTVLNRAVRFLGSAAVADSVATVSVAPIRAVSEESFDQPSHSTPWLRWPLSHPAVVALDLPQDQSRGREILSDLGGTNRVRQCLVSAVLLVDGVDGRLTDLLRATALVVEHAGLLVALIGGLAEASAGCT